MSSPVIRGSVVTAPGPADEGKIGAKRFDNRLASVSDPSVNNVDAQNEALHA